MEKTFDSCTIKDRGQLFELLPPELIEIIIAHLNYDDINSLVNTYKYSDLLKWSTIFYYRFGYYKIVNKDLHLEYLNVQSLRTKLYSTHMSDISLEYILNLEQLFLSDDQLIEIPKEIFNLTNLKELYLGNNQIHEVPAEISKLTNLEILKLYGNQIQEVPAEIFNLINLQSLSFSDNQLRELPAEIGKLTNLKYLYLYNTQLTEIPREISNLTNLQLLDLRLNKLKIYDVPPNLRDITLI